MSVCNNVKPDRDTSMLIRHDVMRARVGNNLDLSVVNGIESVLEENNIQGSSRNGLVMIRFSEGKITSEYGTSFLFPEDMNKIESWFHKPNDEKQAFVSDMYRLDLGYNILIFKEYTNGNDKVLAGHLLVKTRNVRMDLLEMQQDDIQVKLWRQKEWM